jgi:hypothetical protein
MVITLLAVVASEDVVDSGGRRGVLGRGQRIGDREGSHGGEDERCELHSEDLMEVGSLFVVDRRLGKLRVGVDGSVGEERSCGGGGQCIIYMRRG